MILITEILIPKYLIQMFNTQVPCFLFKKTGQIRKNILSKIQNNMEILKYTDQAGVYKDYTKF